MKLSALLLGGCFLLLSTSSAQAQRNKSSDGEPCCNITAINAATSTATARDKAGKTFQFQVRDVALLKTLRVGQPVSVDYGTRKVSVDGGAPCCKLIEVAPEEPCCGVMAVDLATGIVTAKELATARVFRFEVKDAAVLRSLKVGQKVFADFGTSKVRIHGIDPCCNIIGHGVK